MKERSGVARPRKSPQSSLVAAGSRVAGCGLGAGAAGVGEGEARRRELKTLKQKYGNILV